MDTRWIDPEIDGILEGDPELIELANRVRAARPEPPLDPRFEAVLRAQLMREAPAILGRGRRQAGAGRPATHHPLASHRVVAARATVRVGRGRTGRRAGGGGRLQRGPDPVAGQAGHRRVARRRLPRGEPEQRHHRGIQRAHEPGRRRRRSAHPPGHPGDHVLAGQQPADHPHPPPGRQHPVHGDHRPQPPPGRRAGRWRRATSTSPSAPRPPRRRRPRSPSWHRRRWPPCR